MQRITQKEVEKFNVIKESLLYHKIDESTVQCDLCPNHCIIKNGKVGACKCRINLDGTLYVLTYGNISSISCNPMEKKPFFHFYPGTYALTVGSWSCNFLCPWCQNYEISKKSPIISNRYYLSPEMFIQLMEQKNCSGTSFSFNEPIVSLFEYSLDVMPLAKEKGFYNTYVTNGYITEDALLLLHKHGLDAMNIDIKGCAGEIERYIGAKISRVWNTVKLAYDLGIHVELTTLVIPGVNDTLRCIKSIAQKILELSDIDIPWHLSRYFPAYKAYKYNLVRSTPISFLESARDYAMKLGLKYVYIGNVPGHPYENTYCHNCKTLLIRRYIFQILEFNLTPDNCCPVCGEKIPITTNGTQKSI